MDQPIQTRFGSQATASSLGQTWRQGKKSQCIAPVYKSGTGSHRPEPVIHQKWYVVFKKITPQCRTHFSVKEWQSVFKVS